MTAPDTAERILRSARALFSAGGAPAVTMRAVAHRAGVTPMAIYRHFPNRQALLKQIGDEGFEELTRHWAARAQATDALQRVLSVQRLYLDYALRHPHLFDQAFAVPRDDARRYPDDFRERRSPTLTVLCDAVLEAMKQGVLREDDPWDVAMTLWAQAHGLVTLYRAGRFTLDETAFRAFYDASMQRLVDGLRVR